jgi:hypothetical protein
MTHSIRKSLSIIAAALFVAGTLGPSLGMASHDDPTTDPDLPTGWWDEVRTKIADSEYHITWQGATYLDDVGAAWQAPNRAHGFRTYFTEVGIRVVPRTEEDPSWEWGLSLTGIGRGDVRAAADGARLNARDNRIELDRGRLIEWYVNSRDGLKQGFTILEPPEGLTGGDGREPLRIDMALEGNLLPRFAADGRSIEFEAPEGGNVLHYTDLLVTDAARTELRSWMEGFSLDGAGGIRIVVDDAGAQYPVIVDPLAISPARTLDGNQDAAYFGFSVATAGDVDGDGFDDIIVGAYLYDNGEANEGRAYVYPGSASGISANPSWLTESNQTGAYLGRSVSTAGDVNGDGFSDVLVGIPLFDSAVKPVTTDSGRIQVFHGSSLGLPETANRSIVSTQSYAYFGAAVAAAGDVDCDGYGDVVVGAYGFDNDQSDEGRAYVYHGSVSGIPSGAAWTAEGNQAGADFGYSVATTGRVANDRCSGVLVGARRFDGGQTDEGRAYAYYGQTGTGLPAGADWSVEVHQAGAYFGASVATAGDVNGDGYADVIVGAPNWDELTANDGKAFVYHGGYGGLSTFANWTAVGEDSANLGVSVALAGDVNGDGYADVIIGADLFDDIGDTDEGWALVYHGSSNGLDPDGSRPVGNAGNADWTAEGEQAGARLGHSVFTAGDVDGDGFSDVVVGAHRYDDAYTDEGRVLVYHGSGSGIESEPSWGAGGGQAGAHLGCSVASAGDVNGDGFDDLVVGAEGFDNGEMDEGRVYVFHGSTNGPSPSYDWRAESDESGASFGHAVASAGDVNGDGYGDVIVGAHNYSDGELVYIGAAVVYHGSFSGLDAGGARPTGTLDNADWFKDGWLGNTYVYFGRSVACAGDVNGDGYSDVIVGGDGYDYDDSGRAQVYHGSASGLPDVRNWSVDGGYGDRLGYSVASAGDVNGDGFGDIVVGAPFANVGGASGGAAYVFHGSSTGLDQNGTRNYGYWGNADWSGQPGDPDAEYGTSVASAGDVDGDGYSDVVVGAPEYGATDLGRVYVYRGSASGVSASPWWTRDGVQDYARYGAAVASAGDLDGDGLGDLVVGEPLYDSASVTNRGIARIYAGGPVSMTPRTSLQPDDEAETGQFGYSVASAGDVNGDGYADVVVGSRYFGLATNEGKAFVFYGGGGTGPAYLPRQRLSDDSADIGPLGASDMEDRFRIRLWGRPPVGMGRLKLETEVKPLGETFDGSGTSVAPTWTSSGASGQVLSQTVTGLSKATPYHWRARLLFPPSDSPFMRHGRWMTIPTGGWNETDLRTPGCIDVDGDGHGFPGSARCPGGPREDCSPSDDTVYPGAPAICDNKNNDCSDPDWPALPAHETDDDGDGLRDCAGDCNDADSDVHTGATEICNGVDDDCNDLLDEVCDGVCDNPGNWGSDVRVTNWSNSSQFPSVAWTGSEYGVAWQDFRDGNWEIYFARLDASGDLIPGSEVRVTSTSGNTENPSLVWTGAEYGLAWDDYHASAWVVSFTRLSPTGEILMEETRVSRSLGRDFRQPSLVWTGEEYGVAWHAEQIGGNWEIDFARVDASGVRIDDPILVSDADPANSYAPSLVWADGEYGLVWRDKRDGNWELYFTRIDPESGPVGSNVRITNDPGYSSELDLIWTGAEYGVAWNDSRDGDWEVYFATFDENGSRAGFDLRVSVDDAYDSWYPAIAWSGGEYGITWQDARHGNDEVYFARLDSSGGWVEPETRLTEDAASSERPDIVWNGGKFQTVWHDARDGNWEIYAGGVDCCDDEDLDGVTECEDCDDGDGNNYPGNTETCDLQDNDCDTLVDEGFPVPGATAGLRFDPDKSTMHWNVEPVADRYDVVYGDINLLNSSGGFESSLSACLENGGTDTWAYHGAMPPQGEGYYYLVRAEADCRTGTYDSDGAGQAAGRDAGIEDSGAACP